MGCFFFDFDDLFSWNFAKTNSVCRESRTVNFELKKKII
jgi:hypothetical protein